MCLKLSTKQKRLKAYTYVVADVLVLASNNTVPSNHKLVK